MARAIVDTRSGLIHIDDRDLEMRPFESIVDIGSKDDLRRLHPSAMVLDNLDAPSPSMHDAAAASLDESIDSP